MAKKKMSKQKKMSSRVDFTPMVDMMILHAVYYSEQAAGYAVDDAEQRQERAG